MQVGDNKPATKNTLIGGRIHHIGDFERMIKRAHRKSSLNNCSSQERKHINEGKNLNEQLKNSYQGIPFMDPEKNYEWVKANVSSSDNDSLPIRSPKSNKFGDSFFNINAELNVVNRGEDHHNESSNLQMLKHSLQKPAVKDFMEPMDKSPEGPGSHQDPNLLSQSNSVSLDHGSNRQFTQISPSRTRAGLCGNISNETKPSDLQFNNLSDDVLDRNSGFHSYKEVKENNQIDSTLSNFSTSVREWISISESNDKSSEITVIDMKNNSHYHDVNYHSDKDHNKNDDVDHTKIAMKKSSISLFISDCDTEDSEVKSHEVTCRVKLEKIDDKEDRLSQLDEINVSAMKMEELNLPGLKLAHIVTEKLPLSLIHDLPQSSVMGKHSYSCPSQFHNGKDDGSKEVKAGKQQWIPPYRKEKLEKSQKMCQPSRNTQLSHRNVDTEDNQRPNAHNLYHRNVMNLGNAKNEGNSDWDAKDGISSGDYSALSDSSLSIFSVHSSDISFSCPCSTSISHCSMPEGVPSDSLPYLLLQHLSLGKKVKNETMKPVGNEMNHALGGKSKVVGSDENTDESMQCNSAETKVHACDGHSKLHELQKKVAAEVTVADQVSKALNLCHSSSVFSGSSEQVEGERLLLLSTMRKQAAIDEIHQLKSQENSDSGRNECIEVSIQDIKLLLRDDFMEKLSVSRQQDIFYFLCLVHYKETILGTEALPARRGNSTIDFPSKNIKIACELLDDLRINFSVYMLQVKFSKSDKNKGKLNRKSITEDSNNCHFQVLPKHGQRSFFSCGLMTEKHKEKTPSGDENFQTRLPCFILIAQTELHLPQDIDENYFTLHQYESSSNGEIIQPLYDAAHLKISCDFPPRKLDVIMNECKTKCEGFLTQFTMIEDIGAWERGWWCLKGSYLMNWKYPEDQDKSPPRVTLDLKFCVEEVSPVSRLKCARNYTFSIKMKTEQKLCSGEPTTSLPLPLCLSGAEQKEHILSADTRGERDDWCEKLNGILISLQSWKLINLTHVN
ncbi:uncharacterized protein LOC124166521 isoform X2 [Ischnura elegans]|uniref:uncharacterized protein LOC124166521 isoform X2 n=1 Tax=Ischnura elegans TaxID=197161 RepID=UPI001ED875F4|nr:uncharacterized protein LOC124166521 isoform X2 [Ischnura elegans]